MTLSGGEKKRRQCADDQSGVRGQRSVGLFLDEPDEHGEGGDWLVGRHHVTRTLREEWRTAGSGDASDDITGLPGGVGGA